MTDEPASVASAQERASGRAGAGFDREPPRPGWAGAGAENGGARRRSRLEGSARPVATSATRVVGRPALMVAALAAVGIVHVWTHTRVTAAGYRLGELQRTQEGLRAERNRLEVEVATLRAPGRLEAYARARLGMAPPAPGAVVAGWAGEAAAGRAGGAAGRENGQRAPPAEPWTAARWREANPGGDDRVALRERSGHGTAQ